MAELTLCPFCQQPKGNPACAFCRDEPKCQSLTSADTERNDQPSREQIDIHHTAALKTSQQYTLILQWFQQKNIEVAANMNALDTTGFFDEVAVTLGDNYRILREVSDKIKYLQQKGYVNLKLMLSKKSQHDIACITKFCQELYAYSFVTQYVYQKQEKIVRMSLQTVPVIINFFNGEWLEWFVFMKLLELCHAKNIHYSCLRNLSITFPNKDIHELDVFFLLNSRIPVYIECKSGEFRQHIEKYSTLRKRLNLDKAQFLIFVMGLTHEQAQGLTAMYDLTFVNECNFLEHVLALLT